jgi:hypothetical protein
MNSIAARTGSHGQRFVMGRILENDYRYDNSNARNISREHDLPTV